MTDLPPGATPVTQEQIDEAQGRKPQSHNAILAHFRYDHLPPHLQRVSAPFGELATTMDEMLPDGAEKSAGLRKLLEAKDCMVRASLGA